MLHDDEFDAELIANVRPADWKNPDPTGRYNLVVLGAGNRRPRHGCGAAAGVGAKVALIERDQLGGDCLNVGCVPSKALLHSARVVAEIRRAARAGVHVDSEPRVDFGEVMQSSARDPGTHQPERFGRPLPERARCGRLFRRGPIHGPRRSLGRRNDAALQQGCHRHRRPVRSSRPYPASTRRATSRTRASSIYANCRRVCWWSGEAPLDAS